MENSANLHQKPAASIHRSRKNHLAKKQTSAKNPFHSFIQTKSTQPNPFSVFQAKLNIGQSNDQYEKEADQIADQVVNNPIQRKCVACSAAEQLQTKSLASQITPISTNHFGQRKCTACEAEEQLQGKFIQMKGEGLTASNHIESQINNHKGHGSPIDTQTLSTMNSSFGADFSGVRIHTGGQSIQMNQELGARAFTVGNDIHFNKGEYNPGSKDGQRLLAHELTHTIQQGGMIRNKIQRELAIEVANPGADMPELTEAEIQEAIEFDSRRIRRPAEIGLIRDVVGVDAEPAVIDEDFVRYVAWYQASHNIDADGKIGAVTAARFSQEFRAEARGLDRSENRDLRRFSRSMGRRAMSIRVNRPASANDTRGSASFGVMWNIPDSQANGYVIQHVRFLGSVTNCSGNPVASNNAAPPNNYWEAWRVVNGRVLCGNLSSPCVNSDDTFTTATEAANTIGTVQVRGRASFFPDYTLGSGWATTAPGAHPAGSLPHRSTAPPEWSESATHRHTMTVNYNDCVSPPSGTITTTP